MTGSVPAEDFEKKATGKRRRHALGDADRIDAAGKHEKRKHDEHLDEVGGENDAEIGAETADLNALVHLDDKCRDEAEDADRKHADEPLHENEEDLLSAREEGKQHLLRAAVARQAGDCDADGGGDEQDREHVRGEERRQEVVRNHRTGCIQR